MKMINPKKKKKIKKNPIILVLGCSRQLGNGILLSYL